MGVSPLSEMNCILLNAQDNVVTALTELDIGVSIMVDGLAAKIQTTERIPRGHKIAVACIPLRAQVVKYGHIIGVTTSDIQRGQLVHVHNLKSCRGKGIGETKQPPAEAGGLNLVTDNYHA